MTCCENTTITCDQNTIICQLDDTRVSGSWKAEIMTIYGLTPNAISDYYSISIPVIASSVTPATDVNYLGGDYMTIDGNSFGYDISVISVTY